MTEPDARDPLDVVAEEFADRLRRGEHPAVSEYAARHPDLADQLRELLPAVAQMEQLKRFRKAGPAEAALPDRLGDYRIVRELGRGGMGIVFEAVQESLGRRVALKVLSGAGHLDPDRRERFVREAKAAAKLHHTNIVPVFGVGQHGGLPYYVMQLIPGSGLNAVIDGWRTNPTPADGPRFGDWSFAARIAARVADALQYAHDQGVLHRDVKPANLLLDERRRVWIADFGLAKLLDHQTLTVTGDVVGTLQYLAPECLRGGAGPRSDVYGLGATLYELLTLRPPFAMDSPARLLLQVAETDPPPPRSYNPDIPHDLETIVLTAMAREPARRYASAEELADDLRAFLADRPIRARRQTAFGRGLRWCRRNPAVAGLSLSTLVAVVLAAVVGWVGYARTKQALDAEADRRAEAEQASARLEANLRLSLEAFEKVFDAAGGADTRFGPPGGQPGGPAAPPQEAANQAAVLGAVLDFYEQFARQNATNARLRLEAAKAHRRVAEVNQRLGHAEKAGASFRRAEELLEGLYAADPTDDRVRAELVLAMAHGPAADERKLTRAAELAAGLSGPERWPAGTVHLRLGWLREQRGDRAGAAAEYRTAAEAMAPIGNGPQRPGPVVWDRLTALQGLARLTFDKQPAEARRAVQDAIRELEPYAGGGPESRPARDSLALLYQQLAAVQDRLGERSEAQAARDSAARLLGKFGPPPAGGPGGPPFKKDPPFPKR